MAHKSREKSRVRFARVPQGTETCPFCLMLASRGAVYYSKETAGANGHYHPNCKCAIVPVWGNTQIEGYNPKEYYDRWKHPERYNTEKHNGHRSISAESETPILAELQSNHEAQVYRGLTDEQVRAITAFIDGNDSPVASLYRKYEYQLSLEDKGFRGTAFYRINIGVYLDIEEVIQGSSFEAPCQVWFHEFGHHIDYLARSGGFYSSYEQGLGKVVKEEVENLIDHRHIDIKEALISAANAMDYNSMRVVASEFFASDGLKLYLRYIDKIEAKQYSSPKDIKNSFEFKQMVKKQKAFVSINEEIRQIPKIAVGDLSDMLGGATGNALGADIGHSKSYWDNDWALSAESFAEMTSASLTNPDSLNIIKKYLPKSYEKYLEIVGGLL